MCFRAGALVTLARYHLSPFGQLLHQPGKEGKVGKDSCWWPTCRPRRGAALCPCVSQPRGHVTEVRPRVQAQMAAGLEKQRMHDAAPVLKAG